MFATARKAEDIERLTAEGITTFYLDYTDNASIHACADQVLAATNGRLDVLFNNGATVFWARWKTFQPMRYASSLKQISLAGTNSRGDLFQ